jgi:hypothetical protein
MALGSICFSIQTVMNPKRLGVVQFSYSTLQPLRPTSRISPTR